MSQQYYFTQVGDLVPSVPVCISLHSRHFNLFYNIWEEIEGIFYPMNCPSLHQFALVWISLHSRFFILFYKIWSEMQTDANWDSWDKIPDFWGNFWHMYTFIIWYQLVALIKLFLTFRFDMFSLSGMFKENCTMSWFYPWWRFQKNCPSISTSTVCLVEILEESCDLDCALWARSFLFLREALSGLHSLWAGLGIEVIPTTPNL